MNCSWKISTDQFWHGFQGSKRILLTVFTDCLPNYLYITRCLSDKGIQPLTYGRWRERRAHGFHGKFKELVSKVHVLDSTAVEALRNALWIHPPFKKDLYTNNNISLEDALHRVHCFITMKEDKHAYMIKHNAIKSFITVKVEYIYIPRTSKTLILQQAR